MNENQMTDAGLDQQRRAAREALAHDVELLVEKVSPSSVMHRRIDSLKSRLIRGKEQVSERVDDAMEGIGESVQGVSESMPDMQGIGRSTVEIARQRTRQMPLAAGAVFFLLGWALSRVIPMSRSEEQVLSQVNETVSEKAAPIVDQAKTAVTESAKEAIANR